VFKLRNAAAADVAQAIQQFFQQSLTVYTGAQFNSAYQQLCGAWWWCPSRSATRC
jgi:hypothetical protein